MPEPSHQLLIHRPEGLKIGDVGVLIPEDGCFDVFFNICLPADHPFHRATGVPDHFTPIKLTDMDVRTVLNAENPGCILANSSVKSVSTVERSAESSSGTRPTGLEYEFSLSSSEGALLILPEGAQRHDLRNHHRFLELATQHGAEWYRFAQEKVGQIIGNNSLYLVTGFYKTTSWAVAAFEKTAGTAEYPAQFRVAQPGRDNFTATYAWNTTRALEWHAGPINRCDQPNQTVFIRGFKVALRTGMFGARWISVKADTPSTRLNPARSVGAASGDPWLAYIFGGLSSSSRTTQASGSDVQGQVAANLALEDAQNEIQNNRALAVGEHVVIQRMPEASQVFHPSDVINEYLLNKEPSANIAVTHDDVWITMLEEGLLQPEDDVQDGRLETLVSQKYDVISEKDAVYLQSRSESGVSKIYESEGLDHRGLDAMDVDTGSAESRHSDQDDPMAITSESVVANQITGNDPPIAGGSATKSSEGYRCLWSINGIPCDRNFITLEALMVHLSHTHSVTGAAPSKLVCQWSTDQGLCEKIYRRDAFRRHIGTRVQLPYPCTFCGKHFSRPDTLRLHQKIAHV